MTKQEYLKHYGVLGMKWGKRKGSSSSSRKDKKEKRQSKDYKTAKKIKKKKLTEMSNDELRQLNTRMQLERTFKDLKKRDISPGRKFLNEVLVGAAKQTTQQAIQTGGKKTYEFSKKLINAK